MARAAGRHERPRPYPASVPVADGAARPSRLFHVLWWSVAVAAAGVTAGVLWHRLSWYLAVDQFGYLTFATDLLHGHVFHDWPPAAALQTRLAEHTDILAQSYIWDAQRGQAYSRYSPGYPILLAVWMRLFGAEAAHTLNPTVWLVLLGVLIALYRKVLGSRWQALAGASCVLLFPTSASLWPLTPIRDLAAHLLGFTALLLLVPRTSSPLDPRRMGSAFALLGYVACIRPDGLLYLVPAGCVVGARWRRERVGRASVARGVATAACAYVLCLSPALAYNAITTGNPLWPPQGVEVQDVFPSWEKPPAADAEPPPSSEHAPDDRGYPSGAWRGGTAAQVQGGGFRFRNFPRTFPETIRSIADAYGAGVLIVAAWGGGLALVQRRMLVWTAMAYSVPAVLFYSCWGRADVRYLLGVHLFFPLLILEGVFGLPGVADRLRRAGHERAAVLLAVAVAAGCTGLALVVGLPPSSDRTTWPLLTHAIVLPGAALVAACAVTERAHAWPRRLAVAFALVLALLHVQRSVAVLDGPRGGFQRTEVERARATIRRELPPKSVVLTTEDIGRPAENIQFHGGGIDALYLTDLARWRVPVPDFVRLMTDAGYAVFALTAARSTDPDDDPVLRRSHAELVKLVPKEDAKDWFVAAPFHRGVPLWLLRLHPAS